MNQNIQANGNDEIKNIITPQQKQIQKQKGGNSEYLYSTFVYYDSIIYGKNMLNKIFLIANINDENIKEYNPENRYGEEDRIGFMDSLTNNYILTFFNVFKPNYAKAIADDNIYDDMKIIYANIITMHAYDIPRQSFNKTENFTSEHICLYYTYITDYAHYYYHIIGGLLKSLFNEYYTVMNNTIEHFKGIQNDINTQLLTIIKNNIYNLNYSCFIIKDDTYKSWHWSLYIDVINKYINYVKFTNNKYSDSLLKIQYYAYWPVLNNNINITLDDNSNYVLTINNTEIVTVAPNPIKVPFTYCDIINILCLVLSENIANDPNYILYNYGNYIGLQSNYSEYLKDYVIESQNTIIKNNTTDIYSKLDCFKQYLIEEYNDNITNISMSYLINNMSYNTKYDYMTNQFNADDKASIEFLIIISNIILMKSIESENLKKLYDLYCLYNMLLYDMISKYNNILADNVISIVTTNIVTIIKNMIASINQHDIETYVIGNNTKVPEMRQQLYYTNVTNIEELINKVLEDIRTDNNETISKLYNMRLLHRLHDQDFKLASYSNFIEKYKIFNLSWFVNNLDNLTDIDITIITKLSMNDNNFRNDNIYKYALIFNEINKKYYMNKSMLIIKNYKYILNVINETATRTTNKQSNFCDNVNLYFGPYIDDNTCISLYTIINSIINKTTDSIPYFLDGLLYYINRTLISCVNVHSTYLQDILKIYNPLSAKFLLDLIKWPKEQYNSKQHYCTDFKQYMTHLSNNNINITIPYSIGYYEKQHIGKFLPDLAELINKKFSTLLNVRDLQYHPELGKNKLSKLTADKFLTLRAPKLDESSIFKTNREIMLANIMSKWRTFETSIRNNWLIQLPSISFQHGGSGKSKLSELYTFYETTLNNLRKNIISMKKSLTPETEQKINDTLTKLKEASEDFDKIYTTLYHYTLNANKHDDSKLIIDMNDMEELNKVVKRVAKAEIKTYNVVTKLQEILLMNPIRFIN